MADPITLALASNEFGALTALSRFLDANTVWIFLVIALALYFAYPKVRANHLRLYAFAIGFVAATFVVFYAKYAYAMPRPCFENAVLSKLGYCPQDYSFPSAHAAYAFSFAAASVGTSFFPLFLILSAIVALSRIYVGVHTLADVAGGMAVAVAAYLAAEGILRARVPALVPENERRKVEKQKADGRRLEVLRNMVHAAIGMAVIGVALLSGIEWAVLLLAFGVLAGMVIMHFRMRKIPMPFFDILLDALERPGVVPAKGATTYALGMLLALAFLPRLDAGLAVVAVLAFGDSASTIAGRALGGMKWPHNGKKTVAGSAAFVLVGSVAAYPFIGAGALLLSTVCALAETLDLSIDDNLVIPATGILFLSFA